jgi:cytochrome c5
MFKKTLLILLSSAAAIAMTGCGKQDNAAPAAQSAQPAAVAAAAAPAAGTPSNGGEENALGKSTFGQVCAMCHAAGVAGAPKPGDKADWAPRIAQGNDVLYKHALEGFTGSKGMMPARGGNPSLPDDKVKAAVDYMVARSR